MSLNQITNASAATTAQTFITDGCKPVQSETMKEAALIFANRMARRAFGKRGEARTCTMGAYSENGALAEFSAFIGTTKGHETTGHNINFTVYRD